jgi:hypothetical protein
MQISKTEKQRSEKHMTEEKGKIKKGFMVFYSCACFSLSKRRRFQKKKGKGKGKEKKKRKKP